MAISKETELISHADQITVLKDAHRVVETSIVLSRPPAPPYVWVLLDQLYENLKLAELALARRKTFLGQMKRVFGCRDVVACHLEEMNLEIVVLGLHVGEWRQELEGKGAGGR